MGDQKSPTTKQRKMGTGAIMAGSILFLFDLMKYLNVTSTGPGFIDLVILGLFLSGLLLGVGGIWGVPGKDRGWLLSFIGVFYVLSGWLLYHLITTFSG